MKLEIGLHDKTNAGYHLPAVVKVIPDFDSIIFWQKTVTDFDIPDFDSKLGFYFCFLQFIDSERGSYDKCPGLQYEKNGEKDP